MAPKSSSILLVGLVGSILVYNTLARAYAIEECVRAYGDAQVLRRDGKLLESRKQLIICGSQSCPGVVRDDCSVWLQNVEDEIPSVVFSARDDHGKDVINVAVEVDGREIVSSLDGRPVSMNPGPHRFRYVALGYKPYEQLVLIRQGDKAVKIMVKLQADINTKTTDRTKTKTHKDHDRSKSPVAAYVLWGVGGLGMASFAYFGLTGKSELDRLRNTCAPSCRVSDRDAAWRKLIVADVSLGISLAALAAGSYVYFTTPSSSDSIRSPVVAGLGLLPNGTEITVQTWF